MQAVDQTPDKIIFWHSLFIEYLDEQLFGLGHGRMVMLFLWRVRTGTGEENDLLFGQADKECDVLCGGFDTILTRGLATHHPANFFGDERVDTEDLDSGF